MADYDDMSGYASIEDIQIAVDQMSQTMDVMVNAFERIKESMAVMEHNGTEQDSNEDPQEYDAVLPSSQARLFALTNSCEGTLH